MKSKRNNLVLMLVIFLLAISLGYALLNTNLTITGTSKVKTNSWDIHFEDLNVTQGSVVLSTGDSAALINPTTRLDVAYTVTLNNPGDFYEFTVKAVNSGSIDGMIDKVSSKMNNVEITNLPAYLKYSVTYSDGIEIEKNHLLAAGNSETYKVRVEYKRDVNSSTLPTTKQTLSFNFSVTYIQADNSAVEKPSYVYTVNKYDESITEPKYNAVWLNQTFPTAITKYTTPQEALSAIATASSKDLPFYLKQKLENGIVTESYVEFVVTEAIAQANPGMVPGTYTLRGEKTYDSDTSKWLVDENYISPYYEANKEAIKTAFGYSTNSSRCSESGTGRSSTFGCSVSGLGAYAYAYGSVFAGGAGSSVCRVNRAGHSHCSW